MPIFIHGWLIGYWRIRTRACRDRGNVHLIDERKPLVDKNKYFRRLGTVPTCILNIMFEFKYFTPTRCASDVKPELPFGPGDEIYYITIYWARNSKKVVSY